MKRLVNYVMKYSLIEKDYNQKSHNTTELPSLHNQRRTLKRELDSTKRMIEKLTNKDSAKLKHLEEVDAVEYYE